MLAPSIPVLAEIFDVTPRFMGFIEPAYLIPYGAMVLVWGPLSDRVGRRQVILGSMCGFVALTALATLADGAGAFLAARRSEEHTSELQSLMRISSAVFCSQKRRN